MLLDELRTALSETLIRRSVTTASRWAEQYVVLGKPIPGPLRFATHPWEREWMDFNGDWVGKKAAQMGMTNAALMRALFTIDVLRNSVLYILPKMHPDAADFSKSKFDSLLELSPHLQNMFSNVKNIGHKMAGAVDFFLRGSRSRSGLKSISVGLKIFDEFDEMLMRNIELADERSAGYKEEDTQDIKLSTPTFPNFGISKAFQATTQDHYFFQCPHCSLNGKPRWSEILFPESVILHTDDADNKVLLKRTQLICHLCKHPLSENKMAWLNERNSRWQGTQDSDLRGFWIPQFYSMSKPLWKMARQAIRARTDHISAQEFNNSVLAKEYVAEGARITEQMVEACKGGHLNGSQPTSPITTLGVDVGHHELFVHLDEWLLPPTLGKSLNTYALCISRKIVSVPDWGDLDPLMHQYQVQHGVVDVDPDYRGAADFANRFPGRINLCRFVRGVKNRDINPERDKELVLQVNRTVWLDQSQSRYRTNRQSIWLPDRKSVV